MTSHYVRPLLKGKMTTLVRILLREHATKTKTQQNSFMNVSNLYNKILGKENYTDKINYVWNKPLLKMVYLT